MAKVIVIIVAGTLFAFYAYGIFEETFGPVEPQVACTKDAMICPDGSAVGRSGPACEFAQCPEVKESETTVDLPPFNESGVEIIAPLPSLGTSAPTEEPSAPVPSMPEVQEEEMVMCTMDAMQCPDGSYVGRSGPTCQFVCP